MARAALPGAYSATSAHTTIASRPSQRLLSTHAAAASSAAVPPKQACTTSAPSAGGPQEVGGGLAAAPVLDGVAAAPVAGEAEAGDVGFVGVGALVWQEAGCAEGCGGGGWGAAGAAGAVEAAGAAGLKSAMRCDLMLLLRSNPDSVATCTQPAGARHT